MRFGKYEVQEIEAPYGYVISADIHSVELIYAGQNVSVTETATSFYNERQKATLSMQKVLETNDLFEIGNNGEIKNVVFGLYAAEELVSTSGTAIPADGLIEVNRIMFVRRYWHSDSIDDLAKLFHTSNHNISVRLSRTREKLKKHLIKEGVSL